jgi:tripartite-type tricarboxylate transporter receptor subunit TctC
MLGPRSLPSVIVDKLNADINSIIKEPEFAQRIAAEGLIPAGGSPERLLTLIKTELANWARVAKQTGLKAE